MGTTVKNDFTVRNTGNTATSFSVDEGNGNTVVGGSLTVNGYTITNTGLSLISQGSSANLRSNLGLTIGTHVQAYDADLQNIANSGTSANSRTFLAQSNYANMRSTLGVAIGSDVQAYDADLQNIANSGTSANSRT